MTMNDHPLDTPARRARLEQARADQPPLIRSSDTLRAVRQAVADGGAAPDWVADFGRFFTRPSLSALGLAAVLLLGAAAVAEWRDLESTLDWVQLTEVSLGGRT
jgi:hypothetical protein